MKLTGLHIMLTWQCILECEHCFVWGSPSQKGTWRMQDLRDVLEQAKAMGGIEWIYFEGGEPFLYYPLLLQAVQAAAGYEFRVGIVTNGYWAVDAEDAKTWLRPFAGLVQDLSVSSDCYHWDEALSQQARNIQRAAQACNLPVGILQVAQPGEAGPILPDRESLGPDNVAAIVSAGHLPALVPRRIPPLPPPLHHSAPGPLPDARSHENHP